MIFSHPLLCFSEKVLNSIVSMKAYWVLAVNISSVSIELFEHITNFRLPLNCVHPRVPNTFKCTCCCQAEEGKE